MLVHGAKNLRAMQRTAAKATTSAAGRALLAQLIPKQAAQNERLLGAMTFKDSEQM
jgi:hypothetical protein